MSVREKFFTSLGRISIVCLLFVSISSRLSGQPYQDGLLTPEQLINNIRTLSFSGGKIDFVFMNTDVGEIIGHLALISGLHFDLDPKIKAQATYHLRQVPWDQALAAVLSDHELNIDLSADGLKIFRGRKYVLAFNDGKKVKAFIFLYEWLYLIVISVFVLAAGITGLILIKKSKAKRNQLRRKDLLGREQAEEIQKKLAYLLEVKKIYRDDKLTLISLSDVLKITPHQLSWVINQKMNRTFPSLINLYRVEEVKKKLAKSGRNEATILQAAFESGFSTKTSFNKAFKKITGLTPSQYRDKHLNGGDPPSNHR